MDLFRFSHSPCFSCTWHWVGVMSNGTMGLFWNRYRFIYWLFLGCVGRNWVNLRRSFPWCNSKQKWPSLKLNLEIRGLSPPQRPLCVVGRLGRGKKGKQVGSDGKGKERHLPSSPTHFLFFDYCYFYLDTQWKPLQRRESQRPLFAFAINLNRVTHAEVSNVDHNLVFSTVIISCLKVVLSRLCLATFAFGATFCGP